ncbi:inositol polyphosphate kinase family protein [Streptomyces sp. NPDC092369]|uniref:inositol polyphosphate kinase family protein n=1 Tax=Streptomyces sp. NPDC092369 TaxID=3366015 RepID=UPI0037F142C4
MTTPMDVEQAPKLVEVEDSALERDLEIARTEGAKSNPGTPQGSPKVSPQGSPKASASELNAGGHGGIRPIGTEGRILEKPAPAGSVEHEFYRRVRNGEGAYSGFKEVVPNSYDAQGARDLLGSDLPQGTRLDDTQNVYIENITAGLDNKKVLDTKVGNATTSYDENRAQQGKNAFQAAFKSFKFAVGGDLMTGSTFRGWRVVAGTDAHQTRVFSGARSKEILRRFSDDPKVWDQLIDKMTAIRTAADTSKLGFIASSVFSVHGDEKGAPTGTPKTVDAKLIDFAHVIDAQHPFNPASKVDLTAAQAKYHQKFISGMDALIQDSTEIRQDLRAKAVQDLSPTIRATHQVSTSTTDAPKPVLPVQQLTKSPAP